MIISPAKAEIAQLRRNSKCKFRVHCQIGRTFQFFTDRMSLENERSGCGKQDESYQVVSGISFVSFLYIYGIDIFPSSVVYVCEKLRCL